MSSPDRTTASRVFVYALLDAPQCCALATVNVLQAEVSRPGGGTFHPVTYL